MTKAPPRNYDGCLMPLINAASAEAIITNSETVFMIACKSACSTTILECTHKAKINMAINEPYFSPITVSPFGPSSSKEQVENVSGG